jgi:hypothetical protein
MGGPVKKSVKGANKRQRSSLRAKGERNILQEQVAAFEKKFGRRPGPNDPVFFDPAADEPRALPADKLDKDIFAAMRSAGTRPEIVYAFKKTGMLLLDDLKPTYPADAVAEWDAAIDEYFAMELDSKYSDSSPDHNTGATIPPTTIPGLDELPLSADDQCFIFSCLGALDENLEKQPTTLRVKTELAAAVLVMGASSAFDSASILSDPEEAEERYQTFVQLVALRARELFERNRQ